MSNEKKRKTKFDELTTSDIDRYRAEWIAYRTSAASKLDADAIDLIEKAWAAGFFDGEGHTSSTLPDDIASSYLGINLSIDQGYGEPGRANLLRFQKAVGGVGSVVKLKSGEHRWAVGSEEGADAVWAAIGPHLGLAKFIQFREVLQVAAIRALRTEALGTATKKRPNVRTIEVRPKNKEQDKGS